MAPAGIVQRIFDKAGKLLGYSVGNWTAEDGRHYVATSKRGKFAGYRRATADGQVMQRVRTSKKRRIAARRAAR